MARSIEEILEYIDNREAIAEEMSTIAYYGAYWLPIEKDVKSVSMEDINDYETFIPMDCEDSKQEAQKLLEELDFDSLEVEVQPGVQPVYYYVESVE